MDNERGSGIPRRKWAPAEDKILVSLVKKHGTGNWRTIASQIRGREPKQCRERWLNHLDPSVKKGHLTNDEWEVVVRAHNAYGNRWSDIAKLLPGRTPNQIKNYWHSSQRITAIYMSQARKTKRSRDEDSSEDDVDFIKRRRALAEAEMPERFRPDSLDDEDDDELMEDEETSGQDDDYNVRRSQRSIASPQPVAVTRSLLTSSTTLSHSPNLSESDLGEEVIETPSLSPLAQQPIAPFPENSNSATLFASARWAALSQLASQLYLSEHEFD